MNPLVAEFLGTMILIILGNGVVANVVLAKTKGHGGGWIVITAGWGIAVFVGALCSAKASGAHLNPALTLGLVASGKFAATKAIEYIIAQMLGAMVGASIIFAFYRVANPRKTGQRLGIRLDPGHRSHPRSTGGRGSVFDGELVFWNAGIHPSFKIRLRQRCWRVGELENSFCDLIRVYSRYSRANSGVLWCPRIARMR